MKVKSESEVAQLCPTLHDPMDCSQLEWVAIAFSERSVGHSQIKSVGDFMQYDGKETSQKKVSLS